MAFGRRHDPVTGLTKDVIKSLHKDLRGAQRIIGPHLDPDETLLNFFRQKSDGRPPIYIFLTNKCIRSLEMDSGGEIVSFDHEALLGLRSKRGLVRMTYLFGGSGNIYFPTYFLSEGPQEAMAYCAQLRTAWQNRMGKPMPDEWYNSAATPKFEFEDEGPDAPTEEFVVAALRTRLWLRDHPIQASLPIAVEAVVYSPAAAPQAIEGAYQRADALVWQGKNRFAFLNSGGVLAFKASKVTLLAINNLAGSAGESASWEIAWTDEDGDEVHAFFEGPGMALYPGLLEHSADAFLNETGLMDRIQSERAGSSWLGWTSNAANEALPPDVVPHDLSGPAPREKTPPPQPETAPLAGNATAARALRTPRRPKSRR